MPSAPFLLETTFRGIVDQLRNSVSGTQAVILLALDATVRAHWAKDHKFKVDVFASEFSTLLRIAGSTSHDVGTGELTEYIAVSDRAATVARQLDAESFLIIVTDKKEQLGRARYEIKRAASLLGRH